MSQLDTPATRLLQAALAGLATRQRVIANNVANADTPQFKASAVTFEGQLRQAMGAGDRLRLTPVANGLPDDSAPPRVTPQIVTLNTTTRRLDGNNVDIDEQMVQLAETNLSYNALTQLLANRLQLLRTVINDGRR
ncbi:MAG: flagellar basal body rod protein FlgB [Chloroflexi bacterium]|nr:flagellar basal body rod protein FlgB [Chloroflexota bacterium]